MLKSRLFAVVVLALATGTGSGQQQMAPAPVAAAASDGCPAPGERRGGPGTGGPLAQGAPEQNAVQRRAPATNREEGSSGPPKKRLLIWADTRNGIAQHESIGHAEAIIEELGYKSGLWSTWIRTDSNIIAKRPKTTTGDPASGGPSLCNVDAIFFLGHREIELSPEQRADLLWFVHDAGKGFVAAHTGLTAFESWPQFNDLIGGQFENHPWNTTNGRLIVTDPKFPGAVNFAKDTTIRDEFYQAKNFRAADSHVILRIDPSSVDMTKPQVVAADFPHAMAWAKMYGKGRVFYATFAHAEATWDDPRVQELYLGAIKWALGLVDADVAPNPIATPPAK
jgi:type 1 glutamine amidotransferase